MNSTAAAAANAGLGQGQGASTAITVVLVLVLIALFLTLIMAGYYYVTDCAQRKSFWDYLFDMEFQPCTVGATPQQEREIEKQGYQDRREDREKEVFHISDQIYTFDEAACKCNAVSPGARLATETEVIAAFNAGADWSQSGYGWSESLFSKGPDAMANAFFPMQAKTFYQRAETVPRDQWFTHGVPGVNGGLFRRSNRFGINCFGVRPAGRVAVPNPIPPPTEKELCRATQPFNVTHKLRSDSIAGFNKTQWSEYGD